MSCSAGTSNATIGSTGSFDSPLMLTSTPAGDFDWIVGRPTFDHGTVTGVEEQPVLVLAPRVDEAVGTPPVLV